MVFNTVRRWIIVMFLLLTTFTIYAQVDGDSEENQNNDERTIDNESNLSHQFRAGVQFAYYFPNQEGYDVVNGTVPISYEEITPSFTPIGNDNGRKLGSTWGGLEFQIWGDYNLTIPMLVGTGSMTEGNNLQLNSKVSLSPVTMGLDIKAELTPIAFLKFEVGSHIGTGWNINGLGNGLGLNSDGSGDPTTNGFSGIVFRGWFGGTFQFDLSAILSEPNDWTHIIIQSNVKFQYQAYSGAVNGEAWQYLADNGENHNGWKFITSNVLGYQIIDFPINFVGFIIDTNSNLGYVQESSMMSENGWGSDFIFTRFGPLLNWQIAENHSLLFLVQWKNGREYTSNTIGANYFKNRQSTGDYYLYFERFAISYTMKF